MSRLITRNYSTSPKVPMGIQGSTWTPSSQMQGFGAGPSSFQRTRIEKPLKIDKILTKMPIFGRFRSSKSFKLWWLSTNPLILSWGGPSQPPDTHEYTEGIGVVLSNESTKLDVIPVSVSQSFQVSHGSQASQGCHGSQGSQGSQGFQASQAG